MCRVVDGPRVLRSTSTGGKTGDQDVEGFTAKSISGKSVGIGDVARPDFGVRMDLQSRLAAARGANRAYHPMPSLDKGANCRLSDRSGTAEYDDPF